MYCELIVIIEPSSKNMDEAWQALTGTLAGQLFMLTAMVMISRGKNGNVSFEMRHPESDLVTNHDRNLAGDFAEAIFGQSIQDGHSRLTEAGIDPIFLGDITRAFQSNRSAYLLYLPAASRIDSQRLIKSLEPLQGDLYRTMFDPRVEEALIKWTG